MAYSSEIPPTSSTNQIGFIQGPHESNEEFAKRVAFCSAYKDHHADDHLLGWIPLYYTNKGLSFFEGGATFIEERDGIPCPVIHIKKAFKEKKRWLFYDREEIIAHELVHAMRCSFEEPKIEEFIAYQTSKLYYRRYFGPLFTSTKESLLFLGGLTIPVLFSNPYFFAIPLTILGGFLIRLAIRQRKFQELLIKYPSPEERIKFQDLHFTVKTH